MAPASTDKRKLQNRFDFAANPVPRGAGSAAFEDHSLAAAFPMMEGEDYANLVDDVREKGLRAPIVLYEDKVLDGRNRLRACIDAGVQPRFEIYAGADPIGYIVSLNLRRRHLDASQRGMVAARLATLKLGDNQHTKEGARIQAPSQSHAAAMLNISRDTVQKARVVVEGGSRGLQRAVDSGRVSVSAAAEIALADKGSQVRVLALTADEIVKEAVRIKGERQVAKVVKQCSKSRADLFAGFKIENFAGEKQHLDAIIERAIKCVHELDRIIADAMWALRLRGRSMKHGLKKYLKEVEAMPKRIQELLNEEAVRSAPKAKPTRPHGPMRSRVRPSRRKTGSTGSTRSMRRREAKRRG